MLGNPEHGNIGDHAITCGEKAFLRENFSECPSLFLSWRMLEENECYLKSHINRNDIICITGGGFLGSLWPEEQKHVSEVIRKFCNNRVIIFPQTFWHDDSNDASLCLDDFGQALSLCSEVCVCLRERESLNRFKIRYPHIQALLVPDMALFLQPYMENTNDDVLFCLRSDKEKVIQKELKLKQIVESKGYFYRETSTVIDEVIFSDLSEKYVWNKLNEFASARLVITDRLHGMIFAALVGTPCIAFNNISKKVEGVYYWLRHMETIQIVENEQEFMQAFEILEKNLGCDSLSLGNNQYSDLIQYLNELIIASCIIQSVESK